MEAGAGLVVVAAAVALAVVAVEAAALGAEMAAEVSDCLPLGSHSCSLNLHFLLQYTRTGKTMLLCVIQEALRVNTRL